ncbi:MAG TPA: MauE/DoxX family redox-associated membrane protein [Chitinophaga sp.]|uniref:MauE/DoxX family redox-associated membrane protein n=1 Tax=Chitinophaga sp. TaxID=1869181 RepID=UPI002DBE8DB7|nr:MauE/DoxX family redox-associated membrane protein [Chitinophaga sp.]HEU4553940.1 MauE/DoxX family redox-associated membrane protein [Chitinophaga sp.]
MLKRTIPSIVAHLLVVLFLYTGISKLMEYTVFKEQIAASPILAPIAPFVAWALPLTEFIVAVLLFIPAWRLRGLYASFILMLMFTGYVIALVSFSKELPCSCGGVLQEMSWSQHIVFNSVFTLLALVATLLERKNRKSRQATEAPGTLHSFKGSAV